MLKRLMIKGADLRVTNKQGETPVDVCNRELKNNPRLADALRVLQRANDDDKSFWQKFKEVLLI